MRLDSALHAMKPPMPEGITAASDPPASIRSASPRRMWSAALRVGWGVWVGCVWGESEWVVESFPCWISLVEG